MQIEEKRGDYGYRYDGSPIEIERRYGWAAGVNKRLKDPYSKYRTALLIAWKRKRK